MSLRSRLDVVDGLREDYACTKAQAISTALGDERSYIMLEGGWQISLLTKDGNALCGFAIADGATLRLQRVSSVCGTKPPSRKKAAGTDSPLGFCPSCGMHSDGTACPQCKANLIFPR